MSKNILLWIPELQRVVPWRLGLAALACAALACNTAPDETSIQPGAGAGGAGSGGSGGSAGNSGGSGGVVELGDASADTGTGGSAGSGGDSCVVGTLERYCSVLSCPPTFAAARTQLRHSYALDAQIIVQRACSAPDGSLRVSVSANYGSMSKAFIYDAATEQLVGVQVVDDTGDCHTGPAPDPGFGDVPGFYGEASPDCGTHFPDFIIPAACDYPSGDAGGLDAGVSDAGVRDAGPDAGPHECILAP
jgi:hypothetical protein